MKQIEVVAAVIIVDGRVFTSQRGYGEWKDYWEFPGGKMEAGETPQQALIREIHEEMDTTLEVHELIDTIEWDYPTFHLTMHCYRCSVLEGNLTLLEHEAAKWLTAEELDSVNWCPADKTILNKVKEIIG